MRKVKKNIKLIRTLNRLNEFIGQDMETINKVLGIILKKVIGKDYIIPPEQMKTDRDYLDVNIETFAFLYCLANNMSYEKREHEKELIHKSKFFDYLITYKMDLYGQQIFNEMGYQITEITENGSVRFREMTEEEKEVQKRLN